MSRDDLFDKFYKSGDLCKWDPNGGVLSKKAVLRAVWDGAWAAAWEAGREDLAARMCRDLHKNMGKKQVVIME